MISMSRPRFLYSSVFIWLSVTGSRFLAPFLESEGDLDASQIGMALALQQFVQTLSGSVGGAWADRRQRHCPHGRAQVLGVGIGVGTILFMLHGVINLFDDDDGRVVKLLHIAIRACYALSTSFVFPVLDGMTVDFLNEQIDLDKSDYGKERLHGAISWAVTNLCLGLLLDKVGFVVTYPLAVASGVWVVVTLFLYVKSQEQEQEKRHLPKRKSDVVSFDHTESESADEETPEEAKEEFSIHTLLRLVVTSSCGPAFLFAVVCLSSGQAVVESLVFLFFEFLGSSYSIMGWTVVLTVAFEIPIFHIAPVLLQRIGSSKMLILAGFCYITRVLGYTLIADGHVVYVLLLEPLHGITFACSQASIVDFVTQLMPPGYQASGQGIVNLFRGTGSMAGLLLGGWAEQTLGPRIMYRVSALVVAVGCAVFGGALKFGSSDQLYQGIASQTDIELTDRNTVREVKSSENQDLEDFE